MTAMESSLRLRFIAMRILRAVYPPAVTISATPSSTINALRLRGTRTARLTVGPDSYVAARITFERPTSTVTIGARSAIGASLFSIADSLTIGDDVHISWDVTIVDHNSHAIDFEHRRHDARLLMAGEKDWSHVQIAPVRVCNKAWLGVGSTILKGVTVGEGAIVGAKAVVTKDVEPWTIVAGNPAKFIRSIKEA
jgi:acetyltransferase-like isoleucine patch superfamily enzyme